MAIKIVTDSTSDLTPELIAGSDISIVPLYVRFGEETYRDGVDIDKDEFFRRLVDTTVHPSTSQPTPADFAEVYSQLVKNGDSVISIHLSGKLSGTLNSALQAKEMIGKDADITVIDSESVSMGLGMMALLASRLAQAGNTVQQITEAVKNAVKNTHLTGTFDTLKYLVLGGRIGKAKALVGSVLKVKPVLVMRDGELHPVGNVRTLAKGIDKMVESVAEAGQIEEMTVIHTTTPDEAEKLADRLKGFVEKGRLYIARLGPAVGVYGGPGMIALVFRRLGNGIQKTGERAHSFTDKIPKIHKPEIHLPRRSRQQR